MRVAQTLVTARHALVQAWRMLTGYRRVVKWAQSHVKSFLRATQHDLWPWALALAGFKVQTGQLALGRTPFFLLKLSSLPVVAVSKFAAESWRTLLRMLRHVGAWPIVKMAEITARAYTAALGRVR